ncbi:MAG: alpha/beta hydrolase [Rhodobacteraceae bacterium]|nr:alpha/beta hydrolase [Paracoccaceae bacterium]
MSLRLRFLNLFLRGAVKPRLRHLTNPGKARLELEFGARWFFRGPPLTLALPIQLTKDIPALSIIHRPANAQHPKKPVILYLHGGGFIAGSPRSHAKMLARLSQLTGLEVVAPWYRLAPEHPFPAAINDTRAAFNALLGRGYAASDIVLGGDSAGGGLALALLGELCGEGIPPRALFAFSPLTDTQFLGASFSENKYRDPLLPASQKELIISMYLAGQSPQNPRVSPLLAAFKTPPPPVFLQYGESEILRDDSRRMAEKLRAAGGHVTTDEWAAVPHVWVLFDGLLPEARGALQRAADFIGKHT